MEVETSKRLLDRYLRGDTLVEREIDQRYRSRIILLARKCLFATIASKIDPEDVAQESLLAFFTMLEAGKVDWSQRGDLWRLISGIVVNKVRRTHDHYWAAKRKVVRESASDLDVDSVAVDQETAIELIELVAVLFHDEKPLVQTVLKLKLAGWTQQEIAFRIARTERTVRRIIESIRGKIAAHHDFAMYFAERSPIENLPNDEQTSRASQSECPGLALPTRDRADREADPPVDMQVSPLPKVQYDDVQLLKLIGQGSFSKVYLGYYLPRKEHVAIKVMRPNQAHPDIVRQTFENEVNVLSRFRLAGFIKGIGYGLLPNGLPFLAMELLYPETSQNLQLPEDVRLDEDQKVGKGQGAVKFDSHLKTAALLAAIEEFHAQGFIHADLRRTNILFSKEGQATLIDFGFARPMAIPEEGGHELQRLKTILANQIESSL